MILPKENYHCAVHFNVVVVIFKFFAKLFHCHKFKDRPTIDGKNSA